MDNATKVLILFFIIFLPSISLGQNNYGYIPGPSVWIKNIADPTDSLLVSKGEFFTIVNEDSLNLKIIYFTQFSWIRKDLVHRFDHLDEKGKIYYIKRSFNQYSKALKADLKPLAFEMVYENYYNPMREELLNLWLKKPTKELFVLYIRMVKKNKGAADGLDPKTLSRMYIKYPKEFLLYLKGKVSLKKYIIFRTIDGISQSMSAEKGKVYIKELELAL